MTHPRTRRRIMVIGSPGSGKSTVAKALGRKLGLPVCHLDRLYHRPHWTPPPPGVFEAAVARVAASPAWVIDGNYVRTAPPRIAAADLIVYLDVPRWLALTRVVRRIALGYGRQRADCADGCRERLDPQFLRYVWTWQRDVYPRIDRVIQDFAGETLVIRRRRDVRRWLASL